MQKVVALVTALVAIGIGELGAVTVGQVAYVQGSVSIVRGTHEISDGIGIGFSIDDLDMIQTGDNGEMTITTDSPSGVSSTINISPDTTFTLNFADVENPNMHQLELMEGSLSLEVQHLVDQSLFSVQTEGASMGIRGTTFAVNTTATGDVLLSVEKGKVACTTEKGRVLYAQPGEVVQDVNARWGNEAVAASDLPTFRKRWREARVAYLRAHADEILRLDARSYARERGAFERSYSTLLRRQPGIDRRLREAQSGRLRPAQFRRDRVVIYAQLRDAYRSTVRFERIYYRTLRLAQLYRAGIPFTAAQPNMSAAAFFSSVDRERSDLRRKMREVRFILSMDRERFRSINREQRNR